MIETARPEFIVGDEKKFSDFISKLNDKGKIALISHTDLDGIASAKIVNSAVDASLVKFVNYKDLNVELVRELEENKIEKIIFTDLFFKDSSILVLNDIEKFAEILIIDHHTFEVDFNSDRITFLNAKGYCAAYICYFLFSKIKNLQKYDWLAACASVSDFCYSRNQEWMEEIYEKYEDKFEIEGMFIRKKGKMWDLQYTLSLLLVYFDDNLKEAFDKIDSDIGKVRDLEKYSSKILEEIEECLNRFEHEKIEFLFRNLKRHLSVLRSQNFLH